MVTLQDILNSSWNEEKTASAANTEEVTQEDTAASSEEIMKVAMEVGVYNELFPEDAPLGETKTAEEIKLAEYQDALGSRAFDYFAMRFDQRMEKVAGEIMGAADMEAAQGILQPSARPPQAIPTNQDPMGDKAPRSPQQATGYALAAGAEHGAEGQVGAETQQKMAAATQKYLLKMQLGE